MNKIIYIVFSFVIVVSIAGVIFLYIQNNAKTNELSVLNNELEQTKISLSMAKDDVSQTKAKLTQLETDLSTAQSKLNANSETITKLQSDKSKLQKEKDDLTRTVSRVFCATRIDRTKVQSITTNAGLSDIITKAMEDDYNMTSIDTKFSVIWNNSKTAIFTIMGIQDGERYSYKSVVTWDFDRSVINGIYDVGQGCFYYVP